MRSICLYSVFGYVSSFIVTICNIFVLHLSFPPTTIYKWNALKVLQIMVVAHMTVYTVYRSLSTYTTNVNVYFHVSMCFLEVVILYYILVLKYLLKSPVCYKNV